MSIAIFAKTANPSRIVIFVSVDLGTVHFFEGYEICLVAMFLGVAPNELTRMTLPLITQTQWFDKKIRTLHSQGLKYPEIARIMGAPYDVVKAIGEGRY